eukprot:1564848-Prymnesium_polylepis.2
MRIAGCKARCRAHGGDGTAEQVEPIVAVGLATARVRPDEAKPCQHEGRDGARARRAAQASLAHPLGLAVAPEQGAHLGGDRRRRDEDKGGRRAAAGGTQQRDQPIRSTYVERLELAVGLHVVDRRGIVHDESGLRRAQNRHIGRCQPEMLLAQLRLQQHDARRRDRRYPDAAERWPHEAVDGGRGERRANSERLEQVRPQEAGRPRQHYRHAPRGSRLFRWRALIRRALRRRLCLPCRLRLPEVGTLRAADRALAAEAATQLWERRADDIACRHPHDPLGHARGGDRVAAQLPEQRRLAHRRPRRLRARRIGSCEEEHRQLVDALRLRRFHASKADAARHRRADELAAIVSAAVANVPRAAIEHDGSRDLVGPAARGGGRRMHL